MAVRAARLRGRWALDGDRDGARRAAGAPGQGASGDRRVAFSTNKGFNFTTVADTEGPEILVESPTPGRIYLLKPVGDHTFVATAVDLAGNRTTVEVDYEVHVGFEGFCEPLENCRR